MEAEATMNSEQDIGLHLRRLPAPQGAAIAGILFSGLFTTSVVLIRLSVPSDLSGDTTWVTTSRSSLSIALTLMPFAGIAFLWFVGVIRDQLGSLEDQFFSTVFFGSSLLFLAMVFFVGSDHRRPARDCGHSSRRASSPWHHRLWAGHDV